MTMINGYLVKKKFIQNRNGIGQQAKAYVSSLPTKVKTNKNKRIYKEPNTGFRKYMYVNYMVCKAFIKAYKLQLIKYFR